MVSVQCVAFTLCSGEFLEFYQTLMFSSGDVFSEKASPYQTGVVSLEALSIVDALFKGLRCICRVYVVRM